MMAESSSKDADSLGFVNRWGPSIMIGVSVIGAAAIIVGGFWQQQASIIEGVRDAVSTNEHRIDGREAEDRDIRGVIQSTSDVLRVELGRLGDRFVESNREIGQQIGKMRDDLIATMKEGDARLESRFDKLDEKFDILLTKIDYDVIEVPSDHVPLSVGKNSEGKQLGTIPATLKFE